MGLRGCVEQNQYEPQAPAPNSIIAIYQNPSSAQRLINASPFRSEIELKDSVWTYAGSEPLKGAEAFDTDAQSASEEAGRSATEGDPDNDHEGGSSDEANAAAKSIKAEDDGFQGFSGTGKWGAMNRQAKPSLKPSNDQVLPPKGYLVDPTTLPKPDTSNGTPVSTSKIQPPQYKGLPIRRFELYVTPSHMNSQAYIERQGYYTDFVPDRRSIMAEDLEGRVPLEGLFDCRIKKEEVHLRIRNKRKEKDFPNVFSLKALWDNRTV